MINLENSDHGKADALVRRKPSIECGGRGCPPCHQLINPTLLQLPKKTRDFQVLPPLARDDYPSSPPRLQGMIIQVLRPLARDDYPSSPPACGGIKGGVFTFPTPPSAPGSNHPLSVEESSTLPADRRHPKQGDIHRQT